MFKLIRSTLSSTKRNIWTYSKGSMIGYIEAHRSAGFVFKNESIRFRETSSNLSHGEVHDISTSDCLTDVEKIRDFMNSKKHVRIEYNLQVFSFPTRGELIGQAFVTNITQIDK